MTSNEDMATVLEDAADLYQAEKAEWCQGSWYQTPQSDEVSKMTMCAATAIGVAAGLGLLVPEAIAGFGYDGDFDLLKHQLGESKRYLEWLPVEVEELDQFIRLSPESLDLYLETRAVVEGNIYDELPDFNDSENVGRTKQEIIDLFKDTAKELRNGA